MHFLPVAAVQATCSLQIYYILVTGKHTQSAVIEATDNLMSTPSYSTCCSKPQSKYWIMNLMYVSLAILHACMGIHLYKNIALVHIATNLYTLCCLAAYIDLK